MKMKTRFRLMPILGIGLWRDKWRTGDIVGTTWNLVFTCIRVQWGDFWVKLEEEDDDE